MTTDPPDPALDATIPAEVDGPRHPHGALRPPTGEPFGRYLLADPVRRSDARISYRARDPQLDRDVAIELIRPPTADDGVQGRLLARAGRLAKLHHPAVVPVFDIGVHDGAVFIVTPQVAGSSLTAWLAAARRPVRVVLATFLAAGRGLAAAHAAGIAHGDVTAEHIMIQASGEVVLTGFAITVDPGDDLAAARADQQAFCIAMREALRTGDGPRAPAWLLAALDRGADPAPDRRWPSMDALLDHVEARMRRPRRIAVGFGALAVIGAGVALLVVAPGAPAAGCAEPQARLGGVWDAGVRSQVEAAFAATKLGFATDVFARVAPALDRYAEQWRAMHVAACRATTVERRQPAEVLDRRMVCLDRRLAELRTLTSTLRDFAGVEVLQRASTAVSALSSIEDCADADRLLAAQPLPTDPRLRAQILGLEHELDEIYAVRLRGEPKEELRRAEAAVVTARSIGYPPVLARALSRLSIAQSGSEVPSEDTLRELTRVAAEAHDDGRAAEAWSDLIVELANTTGRLGEAKALEPVAEAAVARAGSTPSVEYRFLFSAAARAQKAEEFPLAIERLQAAYLVAPGEEERANIQANLARAIVLKDGPVAALPLAEAYLRAFERLYGANHPFVASALQLLAQLHRIGGNLDQAESFARRALVIREAAFGDDSAVVASTLHTIGGLAYTRDRLVEARDALERAVRILEQGRDNLALAVSLDSLANTLYELEGVASSRGPHTRALQLIEQELGRDTLRYTQISLNHAAHLVNANDCVAAMPYVAHGLAFFATRRPVDSAMPLVLSARCAYAAGQRARALEELERADQLCREHRCHPSIGENARWQLGKLMYESRADRARGLALVREARALFQRLRMPKEIALLDAWLKQHAR